MQLQEIAFLIEFVGVTVQVGEDGLEFSGSVLSNVHERRLVALAHRVASGMRLRFGFGAGTSDRR